MFVIFEWLLGEIVQAVMGRVADIALRVAGSAVLALLGHFGLGPEAPVSNQFAQLAALNGTPDANGARYLDLGSILVESDTRFLIDGWGPRRGRDEVPTGFEGDTSSREQVPGGEASITFKQLDENTSYRLLVTMWLGRCDDSFLVRVNDRRRPIGGVDAKAGLASLDGSVAEVPTGINVFTVHLAHKWTRSGTLTVWFDSVAEDDCGHANIYHLVLMPDVDQGAISADTRDAYALGGLDLDDYCQSEGFDSAAMSKEAQGEGAAYDNWQCARGTDTRLIDMQLACAWAYGDQVDALYAEPRDPNWASTWTCYELPISSGTE